MEKDPGASGAKRIIPSMGKPTEMARAARDEGDGDHSKEKKVDLEDCHDFDADQQEEDGVQDLVDQRPELGDVVPRDLAHRMRTAVVADDQARPPPWQSGR